MKAVIGILLMIVGLFGIYVAIWWAFIGGVMDAINAFRAPK